MFKRVKKNTEEEKQTLSTILEYNPHGIALISKSGEYLYVNHMFTEITGYTLDDVPTGREWFQKAYPDATYRKTAVEAWKKDSSKEGVGGDFEFKITCKNNQIKEIAFRTTYLKNRSISVLTNVTDRKQAEADRDRLLTQLQTTLDSTVDGILAVDSEGKITSFNKRFVKMWKIPDTIIKHRSSDKALAFALDQLKDPDGFIKKVRKLYANPVTRSFDTLEFKDGRIFERYSRPQTLGGNNIGRVWSFRDVTERLRTESALKESEARYREIFKNSVAGICQSTPEGRFITANPAFAKMLGYDSPEELVSSISNIAKQVYVNPEERKSFQEVVQKNRISSNFGFQVKRKDGSLAWLSSNTRGHFDSDGSILHYETVVIDITELKNAEEELRLKTELNQTFLDAIPCVALLMRPKTREIVAVNKAAKDAGCLCGQTCFETWPKTENPCSWCLAPEVWRTGEPKRLVVEAHGIIWDAHWIPITEDLYLHYAFDITEQKNLEAQVQQSYKMDALGTLAGGIAHEFNNILGIIIGNTELAIDDVPEWNPAKSCLEEIKAASLRAKDVVRQILSFTRKTPGERKLVQISTIVKEVLKLIRATIPTSIEIKQSVLCDTELILCNPTEVNQILLNLCSNAAQAMPEDRGNLDVTLEAVTLDEKSATEYDDLIPGDYVKLMVVDNGSGIDPVIRDRIFDPYFTTKDIGEGTGMGLAIVYGLVKKHDGVIVINSEKDKGTSVEVLFPIVEGELEEKADKSEIMPTGTERVLFVDDEPSLADMANQMLSRLGYDVVAKTSSIEALELFKAEPDRFDFVITDMAMPEMAGDQFAIELLKTRPDIPIILCTGHSARIDEMRSKKLGIKAYVMKPLVMRVIAQKIREVLDERQNEQCTGLILLIDDEPQFQKLFNQKLAGSGLEIITAGDGKKGLKLYRENSPNLVVTDLIMPEKEGIETIIELKKEFPDVKIIAISGGGDSGPESYLQIAKKLGAEETFSKPVDWPELIKTIKALLS